MAFGAVALEGVHAVAGAAMGEAIRFADRGVVMVDHAAVPRLSRDFSRTALMAGSAGW